MKLAFVALALVAIAFAAPTTNFLENDQLVPEELLQVGLSGTVSSLKKQFHELEMQLKSGAKVTPGVKDTIDRMIDMVTKKIQPAINDAHDADQETLNTKMQGIATLNSELETDVALVKGEANEVRGLIDKQQSAAKAWDESASLFTATQNNYLKVYDDQTSKCCNHQNSAVVDRRYVAAFVRCDYTKQKYDCSANARADVKARVESHFVKGLALYNKLTKECNDLTTDLGKAHKDTDAKIKDCQGKKLTEDAASKLAAKEQARVQAEWDEMISFYNGNYTAKMTDYQDAKKKVKTQEKDRKSEWDATQTIKCMLLAYKEGGGFNAKANTDCKNAIEVKLDIGYPKEIAQLKPVLEPFEAQTDTSKYENVCDARTKAPVYTCIVREERPAPECTPHELAQ